MKKLFLFCLLATLLVGCYTHYRHTRLSESKHYDNLELGIPGPSDQIIEREGYTLGYSKCYMQPLWVTYRLTANEVTNKCCRRFGFFMQDPLIEGVGAFPEDYFKTGYDRGHLAPAADMYWSTNAMFESFYMSNISPQTPELNRRTWLAAESFARSCAVKEGSVFIVTGPICTNTNAELIGISNITVPDAFYKVIYDEVPPEKMMAFVMPNKSPSTDMWSYATNVAYVEEITGYKFFPNVATNLQQELKYKFDEKDWKVYD